MADEVAATPTPASRSRRQRGVTLTIAAATLVAWLIAESGHIAISLFEHDAMPEWMRLFTHVRGPIRTWQTLAGLSGAVLLVTMAARLPRRGLSITVGVIAAIVGLALGADGPRTSVQHRFELMRPDLERAAALPAVVADPNSKYYFDLPPDLAYLAVYGTASTNGEGELFVPQWAGIPDDAGGFILSPGGNPSGRDMSGMTCKDPIHLDGNWWACGLNPRF